MSSTFPPDGSGGPGGPGPERLSPEPPRASGAGPAGRRRVLVGGAALAVAGLVGGGAWAATSFLGGGAQPSEVLPAGTLGYVSVDLDPSGRQKIEALRTLRAFPAFREAVGLDTGDDVRRYLFEQTLGEGGCADLDFDDDVAPWLGDRFAVAVVPAAGEEDQPRPVAVVQVSDAGAAADGLDALRACAGAGPLGYAVEGDWAVLATTDDAARAVVAAAADGSLADDADFTRWTGELEPGVLTAYAAPEVGAAFLAAVESAASANGSLPEPSGDPLADLAQGFAFGLGGTGEVPDELRRQAEAFRGAAGAVRFDDGALELDVAVGGDEELLAEAAGTAGGEAVRSLPEDTAAALGVGFVDGWADTLVDRLESGLGAQAELALGSPVEDLLALAERETGLQLPEDLETLLGDSLALAVGGGFSVRAAEASPDGADVPVGAKVIGDAEGVQRVLGALDRALGFGRVVGDDAEGDVVAIGPSADYRRELLEDGGLGDTERFEAVVEGADEASAVLFVDLDATWVQELVETSRAGGGADDLVANLEPLSALGASSRVEGGTARFALRITTG